MNFYYQLELVGRIVLAGLCGAIIGYERKNRRKEAGIRTHIIVALSSALMMIISKYAFFDLVDGKLFPGIEIKLDPSRMAQGIVTGVGFLGAGMIFVHKKTITGLTTAAGIWGTSGIGMAIGAGLYFIGIISSLIIVFVQIVLHKNIKFLRREPGPEHVTFKVNDYKTAMQVIETYFKEKKAVPECVSMRKTSEEKTELEFIIGGHDVPAYEIMNFASECEIVDAVKIN